MRWIHQHGTYLSIAFSVIVIVSFIFAPPVLCDSHAWKALGPYGGPVSAFGIDPTNPKTIYAAPDGVGIFKSIDA
jgi:hypothetical protein